LWLLAACGGPAATRPAEPPTAAEPAAGAVTPGAPAPRPVLGPSELVAEARAAIDEGRYDQAARALLEATGLAPAHAEAQRLLGVVRLRQGDLAAATGALDRARAAAEAAGDGAEAHEALRLLVRVHVRRGDARAAESAVEAALAAAPDDLDYAALRQWVWLQQGRAREVVATTRDLLRKDETNVALMVNLADAYRQLGQLELADYVLRTALQVTETADVHHGLAEVAAARGEPQTALGHLRRAAELAPDSAEILNNLGVAYHWAGDDEAAVAVLATAVQLAPAFAKAFVNLGNAYRRQRAYDRAEDAYRRALEIEPRMAAAWYNLGILFFETTGEGVPEERRYTEAIAAFNQYKVVAGAALPKDDPVDKYIVEARLILEEIERSRSEERLPVAERPSDEPEPEPGDDGPPVDGPAGDAPAPVDAPAGDGPAGDDETVPSATAPAGGAADAAP
jgi:tetratricopeptide (TPR) repeat protein